LGRNNAKSPLPFERMARTCSLPNMACPAPRLNIYLVRGVRTMIQSFWPTDTNPVSPWNIRERLKQVGVHLRLLHNDNLSNDQRTRSIIELNRALSLPPLMIEAKRPPCRYRKRGGTTVRRRLIPRTVSRIPS